MTLSEALHSKSRAPHEWLDDLQRAKVSQVTSDSLLNSIPHWLVHLLLNEYGFCTG